MKGYLSTIEDRVPLIRPLHSTLNCILIRFNAAELTVIKLLKFFLLGELYKSFVSSIIYEALENCTVYCQIKYKLILPHFFNSVPFRIGNPGKMLEKLLDLIIKLQR